MSKQQSSPTTTKRTTVEMELSRLQRRRQAVNQLIRSLEEYLMVSGSEEVASTPAPKKPNLRVVYGRHLKELMA